MTNQRSYAHVWWQNNRPGLLLAGSGRSYFIFAEYLLALYQAPGTIRWIKKRDAAPEKAIAHHPGDIYAKLDFSTNLAGCRIVLYYGEGMRSIEITDGRILNTVAVQTFILPTKEMDIHFQEIRLILQQRELIDKHLLLADTAPPVSTC